MTSQILALTWEHLQLVLVAIVLAAAVGFPAAIALTRRPTARRWAVGFANIAQTIVALLKNGALELLATPDEFLAARSDEARAFLTSLESR